MVVKVKRCEIKTGERQDGTPFTGTDVVVIFGDKITAARLWVADDVCDPCDIQEGGLYDLFRDEKGRCLVFDKYEKENK